MPCRCSDRRTATAAGARALARGDLRSVGQAAGFITRTAVEDMARLMGRRRSPSLPPPADRGSRPGTDEPT